MSTITACLNYSILHPLVQTCNSCGGGAKKLIFTSLKRITLVLLAFFSVALSVTPVIAAVVPGDLNIIDSTYGAGAGSFELGSFEGNGFMTLSSGSTTITGWTVGGCGVDWLTPPTFGAKQGIHSADLTTTCPGSLSTVIPTISGVTYRLSFSGSTGPTGLYTNSGVVSAGSLQNQLFSVPNSPLATPNWVDFTHFFTATGPSTSILFQATSGTVYGPAIDSVSVIPVSDLCGSTLKTACSYEFSLELGTQKTESIQLFNPGTVSRTATLEILNPHAGSGLTVSFTPATTISLAPGETKDIPIALAAAESLPKGMYDGILLKITDSVDGSILYSNIKVYVGAGQLPDLTLSSTDISATTNADGKITLTAEIHNQGTSLASNVQVQFYEFGRLLDTKEVAQIQPKGTGRASITVDPMSGSGDHLVRVVIDPSGAIPELDETNNEASQIVKSVSPSPPTEGNMLVTSSAPSTVYVNSLFTLTGHAVYAITIDDKTNTDYVVKGGAVQITISADGGAQWVYGDIHTNTAGDFSKVLQAPASPGTYRLTMKVTDNTFVGTRELDLNVIVPPATPPQPPNAPTISGVGHWTEGSGGVLTWTWITPPPANEPSPERDLRVFSENIHFTNEHPAPDEQTTLFAEIQYWASNTTFLSDPATVNVYVTDPVSGTKTNIGQTVIKSLSVGSPDLGSRYVYASWKNRTDGIYLVEFEIAPSYAEYTGNNAATRAIIVGQLQSSLGVISGQVTSPIGGVGDVKIHVLDANNTEIGFKSTDQTGSYLIKDVPLGTLQVKIDTPSGYQPDAPTKTVTVSTEAPVGTVNFKLVKQAGINGTCGSANEQSFPTAPTTELCSTGTASPVSGTGPWNWTCAGSNGGTTASCSANLQQANPITTGAKTIGFWQNQNGQAILTGGASTSSVCNSGTWLRQYTPYQDMSATATCSQVATYVTKIIKAANASGASMNAMLKAQMLATSLDVYFSDPTLGGNKIAAPLLIGGVSIDLTRICGKIDSSSGTATCSGGYQNATSAFGGAPSQTISEMLAYAASQSNVGGSQWYGNIRATQALVKNAFDAINNQVALAP